MRHSRLCSTAVTFAMLATRFGSDIGARGPNGAAPCLDGPFSVQRCNGASQISFTPVQPIVFDPRTQSYVVFSPIERLVIKPAAGVPTVADPRTGELLLFDTPHQRIYPCQPDRATHDRH